MQTTDLLKSHRSIRKFTAVPIAPKLMQSILEAGQAAATSSYAQAYTLIRVTDTEKRNRLVELTGNQPYVATCAEFFVCCADLNRNMSLCSQHGTKPEAGFMEHMIIATVDVALVAQNMVIAAESEGLGICYIGGIRNEPEQVSELLGLPQHVYPVFGLCLGYPDQDPEVKPRLPLDSWVHENRYTTTSDHSELAQYDARVRQYYQTRTKGKKSQTWSEQMVGFFSKESRPHMLGFLHSKGMAKR